MARSRSTRLGPSLPVLPCLQDFTQSAVLAYECGHAEGDLDEQLGRLPPEDLSRMKVRRYGGTTPQQKDDTAAQGCVAELRCASHLARGYPILAAAVAAASRPHT